jgi:hypothetical protein
MQCGTPSVTRYWCRIDARLFTWNGFVADDPDVFAKKAVQLYQDKSCWLQAQKNGLAIIEQRYLISLFETEFKLIIDNLQSNLQQHRLNNFMGAVLQHHTLKVPNTCPNGLRKKELAFSNLYIRQIFYFLINLSYCFLSYNSYCFNLN